MPKSSSAMRTPRARNLCNVCSVAGSSRSSTDSVISSSRRSGRRRERDKRVADRAEQVGATELRRRQVHRDADRVGPYRRVLAGLLNGPLPHCHDEARLLRQRDELHRRDQPLARVAPSHQRFAAMRGAGLGINDRLVVQLELPLLERVGEIALESAAGLLLIAEQRVEKLERCRARLLSRDRARDRPPSIGLRQSCRARAPRRCRYSHRCR